MAQLYAPPFTRFLRSLLLQCVFLLGIVSLSFAQTTKTYDGPWRNNTAADVTTSGLSIDGADLETDGSGGSAQLRTTTAFVNIKLRNADGTLATGFKVSYSAELSTTRGGNATMQVQYSTDNGATYTSGNSNALTLEVIRDSVYLPGNATDVKFSLSSVTNAYAFLDAIEVTQAPEISGFTPDQGVPGTPVTITGNIFNGVSEVYFGDVLQNTFTVNTAGTEITTTVPTGASTGFIKLVTPYGDEATSATEFVVPAPVISGFMPAAGGAGDVITITGQYFTGATSVAFNGVAATPTSVTDTEITVAVPAAATDGKLTVVTPAGSDESETSFDVLAPTITAFLPSEGGPVGTSVTLQGNYLASVTKVYFNGVEAQFTITDNNIATTVPLGAGTGYITVKAPAGNGQSDIMFNVPAPTITGIAPTAAGPNMTLTITGTNLSGVTQVVFLGDSEGATDDRTVAVTAIPATDDQLTVAVPADASTGKIQVVAPEGKEDTSDEVFTFVPAPVITSVTNTQDALEVADARTYGIVGDEITITGENFGTATEVVFGGVTLTAAATEFTVSPEGTAITFNIPTGATTGAVTVKTQGGTATWNGPFEVVQAPVYTSMDPTEGPLGRQITITGENLKYVSEVVFPGADGAEVPATVFSASSDTELLVTVPDGAVTGPLQITNPAGSVTTTDSYTVILIPVIESFDPVLGVAANTVTITGYNFTGTTAVTFGDSAPITTAYDADTNPGGFNVVSDAELTVQVPIDATTGVITITNAEGSGSSEENFTIIQTPTITDIDPVKGKVGDQVVITGTEFIGEGIVVTFLGTGTGDEVVAATFDMNSPTQITATVPTGAVTGPLMVTNAAGTSEPSTESYEVVTVPEITSFSPTQGKVGDEVVLTGWFLNQVEGVQFNGTAAEFTLNPDNTITAIVPVGATTGKLSLVEGNETVFTTEADFTVFPAPIITSFDPTEGVANTLVTITGENFQGLSKVTFLGTEAEGDEYDANLTAVDLATVSTEFMVPVPTEAVTGKIQVTAAGGTATSEADFVVPAPTDITFEPTTSYANQQVTIRGRYLENASEITFNGRPVANIGIVIDELEDGTGNFTGYQTVTVKAPFDAGTGPIVVTTPAGKGTSEDNYTVIEPNIISLTSEEGTAKGYAGSTVLTITGQNLSSYYNGTTSSVELKAPTVTFHGNEGSVATATPAEGSYSDTEVTVVIPSTARTGTMTVASGSGISNPVAIEILKPTISSVNPTAVYAGEWVDVTGTNYIEPITVNYGGIDIPLNDVDIVSETSLAFIAPVVDVTTSNALTITTQSGSTDSYALTVYKPLVSNLNKNRVYAGVNTVTISGTRLDEYYQQTRSGGEVRRTAPSVTFASTNGNRINGTISSATYSTTEEGTDIVTVNVPAGAVTGNVRVSSLSGTGESTQTLTIIGAPTITGFSVSGGVVGTTFTITGTNFDEATAVAFTGSASTIPATYTVLSPTEIQVTVPNDALAGQIAVTTPYNGGTTVTSNESFRVVYAPVYSSFSPASGPKGTEVTISGENLWDVDGALEVYFKGHGGATIPAADADKIDLAATVTSYDEVGGTWVKVTVPDDAISGTVTLTNAANTTEAGAFEVTSPVIVRFEDADNVEITSSNPARIKETVFAKGYQLQDIGVAKVGSITASFLESDVNTLEMLVPRSATTNTVSITAAEANEVSSELLYIQQPIITVTPNSLSFKAKAGENSAAQSYTVSAQYLPVGENLNIAVASKTDYYYITMDSTDTTTWAKTVTALTTDGNGTVAETIVYVRAQPAEDVATNLSGTITNSSYSVYRSTVALNSIITPLPVELMSFDAALQKRNVVLRWVTASEENNSHFEVEMSTDPKQGFEKIGVVESKVTNSVLRTDYTFTHKLGNASGTIYFRLKQVDLDGTTDYSKVIAINVKALELVQKLLVAPNPINFNSKVYITAEVSGKATLTLHSITGQRVYRASLELEEGENEVQLPVYDKITKGMYVLTVELNGQTSQVKVIKE
ncbi:IPT/TIG domain-containing protein [Pontibacter mangrovi]|uniref:T9SS type A sorting domain-containing protein n=1 Tax=Pontibacter mangrovi TaxID=2589816 RepID=A0A501WIV2_9BACT|nr:IPT/TIG domain-containing protein [Pontibacter mangrovi]TPE45516.1 T9SS type A sorting domain-containing protein [Pontibacter mangrovi]